MLTLNIFGASCLTGQYLKKISLEKDYKINSYSKSNKRDLFIDLNNYKSFFIKNHESRKQVWISLSPIWLFANFMENLAKNKSKYLNKISILIVTSSSSAETKKYAFNNYDKNLSKKLDNAENKLIQLSKDFGFKICILRPTLIYGQLKEVQDRNILKILQLMRRFPLIICPKDSGMRQPIHASQLAKLCLYIAEKNKFKENTFSNKIITVGGDQILSFYQMLVSLKKSINNSDKAKNCIIIKVNKIVFLLIIYPVSFFSPRIYESFLRIYSDLAGFDSVSRLMGIKVNKKFPLIPYN